MTDILMVIKTTGLSYDDRVRKECTTLRIFGNNVKIAALESENKIHEGLTEYGTVFQTISLYSRKVLSHKKGLFLKTVEMYANFALVIFHTRPNIVWLHNVEMAGLVPFCWVMKNTGVIKKLVWDQHELPAEKITNNRVLRDGFKVIVNLCDILVFANGERRELLSDRLGTGYDNSFKVIENFVDNQFFKVPRGSLPHEIEAWLSGQSYILAQGGANPDRYLENVIAAVMDINDIKLIVVGPFDAENVNSLQLQYGKTIEEEVFFTGMVPQFELVNYIDNALASIVLYNAEKPNSRLCAPNRLYQALSRGVPVIVGSNPPMKNLVKRFGCGVVLKSDGRDVTDIRKGIHAILADGKYKENAVKQAKSITWESQNETIAAIVLE